MSELVDIGDSSEQICMEITENDIISELDYKNSLDSSSGKIRFEKSKNHRWKPYEEMSCRERQRLEERNTRRVLMIRKEMLRYGLTSSPHYTTPHHSGPDNYKQSFSIGNRHRQISTSQDSSEDIFSSPEEEEDFIQRNFDDTYKAMYSEYLNRKSNQDLVREVLDTEDKIEELEKELRAARYQNQLSQRTLEFGVEAELEKIRVFRKEIEKLTEENNLLRTENFQLNSHLSCPTN